MKLIQTSNKHSHKKGPFLINLEFFSFFIYIFNLVEINLFKIIVDIIYHIYKIMCNNRYTRIY